MTGSETPPMVFQEATQKACARGTGAIAVAAASLVKTVSVRVLVSSSQLLCLQSRLQLCFPYNGAISACKASVTWDRASGIHLPLKSCLPASTNLLCFAVPVDRAGVRSYQRRRRPASVLVFARAPASPTCAAHAQLLQGQSKRVSGCTGGGGVAAVAWRRLQRPSIRPNPAF